MKISIIVPAFNEERLLGGSLAQIKRAGQVFEQRGWDTELIVCDNNSTDQTAAIARAAGATVVFEPLNQIGRARNRGAAAADGDWLIFIDADSAPGPDLFSDVAAAIESGGCIAGGATVRLDQRFLLADFIVRLWNFASRWRRLLAGAFIFIQATTFKELGGFSNELFVGEELDLSRRLNLLAKETGKQVVILHRHPLPTSARKMRLYTKRQHLAFLRIYIFDPRRATTSPQTAHLWYDGRR